MKKALITGVTGQDGSYLAELLLEKGTLQKERNRLYEEDAAAKSRLRSIERIGQNVHAILEPVDQREQDREKNR